MHFYFKGYDLTSNKIKWYSNIGLLCDYNLGIKNAVDPLINNGKTRKRIRKVKDYEPLPISAQQKRSRISEPCDLDRAIVKDIYMRYRLYCYENRYQPVSQVNFSRQIRQLFGYVSKKSKWNKKSV